MGYLRRHAIIVTGYDGNESKEIKAAHRKASDIFPWVSEISPSQINGEKSFFIPPDGSKEGWADSDLGDKRRDEFIGWLNSSDSFLCWVEVSYGEDDPDTKVTRASDVKTRGEG